MNILHAVNKSPVQRDFLKNSAGNLLPVLSFLSELCNLCKFVSILYLM